MSNIVLSIDGRKEVNDRMRYRADGSGSYDKIAVSYTHLYTTYFSLGELSALGKKPITVLLSFKAISPFIPTYE